MSSNFPELDKEIATISASLTEEALSLLSNSETTVDSFFRFYQKNAARISCTDLLKLLTVLNTSENKPKLQKILSHPKLDLEKIILTMVLTPQLMIDFLKMIPKENKNYNKLLYGALELLIKKIELSPYVVQTFPLEFTDFLIGLLTEKREIFLTLTHVSEIDKIKELLFLQTLIFKVFRSLYYFGIEKQKQNVSIACCTYQIMFPPSFRTYQSPSRFRHCVDEERSISLPLEFTNDCRIHQLFVALQIAVQKDLKCLDCIRSLLITDFLDICDPGELAKLYSAMIAWERSLFDTDIKRDLHVLGEQILTLVNNASLGIKIKFYETVFNEIFEIAGKQNSFEHKIDKKNSLEARRTDIQKKLSSLEASDRFLLLINTENAEELNLLRLRIAALTTAQAKLGQLFSELPEGYNKPKYDKAVVETKNILKSIYVVIDDDDGINIKEQIKKYLGIISIKLKNFIAHIFKTQFFWIMQDFFILYLKSDEVKWLSEGVKTNAVEINNIAKSILDSLIFYINEKGCIDIDDKTVSELVKLLVSHQVNENDCKCIIQMLRQHLIEVAEKATVIAEYVCLLTEKSTLETELKTTETELSESQKDLLSINFPLVVQLFPFVLAQTEVFKTLLQTKGGQFIADFACQLSNPEKVRALTPEVFFTLFELLKIDQVNFVRLSLQVITGLCVKYSALQESEKASFRPHLLFVFDRLNVTMLQQLKDCKEAQVFQVLLELISYKINLGRELSPLETAFLESHINFESIIELYALAINQNHQIVASSIGQIIINIFLRANDFAAKSALFKILLEKSAKAIVIQFWQEHIFNSDNMDLIIASLLVMCNQRPEIFIHLVDKYLPVFDTSESIKKQLMEIEEKLKTEQKEIEEKLTFEQKRELSPKSSLRELNPKLRVFFRLCPDIAYRIVPEEYYLELADMVSDLGISKAAERREVAKKMSDELYQKFDKRTEDEFKADRDTEIDRQVAEFFSRLAPKDLLAKIKELENRFKKLPHEPDDPFFAPWSGKKIRMPIAAGFDVKQETRNLQKLQQKELKAERIRIQLDRIFTGPTYTEDSYNEAVRGLEQQFLNPILYGVNKKSEEYAILLKGRDALLNESKESLKIQFAQIEENLGKSDALKRAEQKRCRRNYVEYLLAVLDEDEIRFLSLQIKEAKKNDIRLYVKKMLLAIFENEIEQRRAGLLSNIETAHYLREVQLQDEKTKILKFKNIILLHPELIYQVFCNTPIDHRKRVLTVLLGDINFAQFRRLFDRSFLEETKTEGRQYLLTLFLIVNKYRLEFIKDLVQLKALFETWNINELNFAMGIAEILYSKFQNPLLFSALLDLIRNQIESFSNEYIAKNFKNLLAIVTNLLKRVEKLPQKESKDKVILIFNAFCKKLNFKDKMSLIDCDDSQFFYIAKESDSTLNFTEFGKEFIHDLFVSSDSGEMLKYLNSDGNKGKLQLFYMFLEYLFSISEGSPCNFTAVAEEEIYRIFFEIVSFQKLTPIEINKAIAKLNASINANAESKKLQAVIFERIIREKIAEWKSGKLSKDVFSYYCSFIEYFLSYDNPNINFTREMRSELMILFWAQLSFTEKIQVFSRYSNNPLFFFIVTNENGDMLFTSGALEVLEFFVFHNPAIQSSDYTDSLEPDLLRLYEDPVQLNRFYEMLQKLNLKLYNVGDGKFAPIAEKIIYKMFFEIVCAQKLEATVIALNITRLNGLINGDASPTELQELVFLEVLIEKISGFEKGQLSKDEFAKLRGFIDYYLSSSSSSIERKKELLNKLWEKLADTEKLYVYKIISADSLLLDKFFVKNRSDGIIFLQITPEGKELLELFIHVRHIGLEINPLELFLDILKKTVTFGGVFDPNKIVVIFFNIIYFNNFDKSAIIDYVDKFKGFFTEVQCLENLYYYSMGKFSDESIDFEAMLNLVEYYISNPHAPTDNIGVLIQAFSRFLTPDRMATVISEKYSGTMLQTKCREIFARTVGGGRAAKGDAARVDMFGALRENRAAGSAAAPSDSAGAIVSPGNADC